MVSLQAPNKEEMYYYALISHKRPLLWLFPRCVSVKRDFVSCSLQQISLCFKIKMKDLFISSHNQNLTCVWGQRVHTYILPSLYSPLDPFIHHGGIFPVILKVLPPLKTHG